MQTLLTLHNTLLCRRIKNGEVVKDAGAVVTALYAVGYTPNEMEALALSLNTKQLYDSNLSLKSLLGATINTLLSLLHVPSRYDLPFPQGLIQGKAWEQYLYRQLGPRKVSSLELPIAILATDIDTGQGIVFSQEEGLGEVTISDAPLAQAVRASSAIPGVFCPAYVDGRTLVDGQIRRNGHGLRYTCAEGFVRLLIGL